MSSSFFKVKVEVKVKVYHHHMLTKKVLML